MNVQNSKDLSLENQQTLNNDWLKKKKKRKKKKDWLMSVLPFSAPEKQTI